MYTTIHDPLKSVTRRGLRGYKEEMEKPSNQAKSIVVWISAQPPLLVGNQTNCSGRTIEDRVVIKVQIGNQGIQSCGWLDDMKRHEASGSFP